MALVGYAGVKKTYQDVVMQFDTLAAAECCNVFEGRDLGAQPDPQACDTRWLACVTAIAGQHTRSKSLTGAGLPRSATTGNG